MAKKKTASLVASPNKSARRAGSVLSTGAAGVSPSWGDLTRDQRVAVWRKMFRTYRRVAKFAAGRYNIVGSSKHTRLRERAQVEFGGEDDALTQTLRNQFINLARNGVRNNETLNAILLQFKLNVIGTVGGKAYFDFGPKYEDSAEILRREFSRHCNSCEFFDGMKFSEFLEHLLETVCIGGDCVVAFDNHTFEDSGKLIGYEPDSIANLKDSEFRRQFGNGYRQSHGRVYTPSNRFCGVIVSSSERGKAEFDNADDVHVFQKDPNEGRFDVDWIMIGHRWRWNQGRGTSPLTAPLGSFIDVDILQGFEIEAGKLNSQMCAQVYQTGEDETKDPDQSPDLARTEFDAQANDAISDEAVEAAADELSEDMTPSFQELESAGVVWNLMPANSKMEMLDTKHPNPNMNDFIRLVAARGGWANGLAACFVTGKVDSSYSGYRGEQLMSWPAFWRWQKFLEDFCDWHFRRWFEYAKKWNPDVAAIADRLPPDLFDLIEWEWPKMREVNAVDEQTAFNMGLKNGSITYRDKLGPGWRRHLEQVAMEKKVCRSLNLLHPNDETASGQIVGDDSNGAAVSPRNTNGNKGGENAQ